jgi:hypothetical protein
MTREEWLGLFNKIPETMHDQVVLSISTGIDVCIQRFLQFTDQNLVVRGRLGGTDEGERIFLVPWPEIRLLYFSRPVGDELMFSMFGDLIGGVRKSMIAKKDERDIEEEEEHSVEPMHLTPSYDHEEEVQAKPAGVNLEDVRQRLLQPRKPPPRTETNKPGPGKPSPTGKPVK